MPDSQRAVAGFAAGRRPARCRNPQAASWHYRFRHAHTLSEVAGGNRLPHRSARIAEEISAGYLSGNQIVPTQRLKLKTSRGRSGAHKEIRPYPARLHRSIRQPNRPGAAAIQGTQGGKIVLPANARAFPASVRRVRDRLVYHGVGVDFVNLDPAFIDAEISPTISDPCNFECFLQMLSEGVRLQQFQLIAVEIFSCEAQLTNFDQPPSLMEAHSRYDHIADAIGRQLAVYTWLDRFGCKFNNDQMFHRCPAVYRSRDCVFQFSGGMQQIGHRAIMELVSSNKDRETN